MFNFVLLLKIFTAQKVKFSSTDFFSECDQIRSSLRIWSQLPKKSVMENFIFCSVFDSLQPGSYDVRLCKIVSKIFEKFFSHKKYQIMIIKLFKG